MRVYRLDPKTGRKQWPMMQDGCYVLADPKHGKRKHHAENKVLVRTEDELIDHIVRGFSVRVDAECIPSLVRLNLFVDGKRLT